MNTTFTTLYLGAALMVSAIPAAHAADASDQIAASFGRMMQETTTLEAPRSLTQLAEDPLFQRLTAQVWLLQPSRCGLFGTHDEVTVSSAAAQ